MKIIEETAIIRDRGQITIPNKVRDALIWPITNSVVSLTTTIQNEIIIKPYSASEKTNWDKVWAEIAKARSTKGKQGNLSGFIAQDRNNH